MRIVLAFVFMLFLSLYIIPMQAQNLVPNPSFEEYIQLPPCSNYFQPTQYLKNYLFHWDQPTNGSTDFWYTQISTTCILNPLTTLGKQPNTGYGCTGLITFSNEVLNTREYLEIKLNNTLSVGKVYSCGFYVNPKNKILKFISNNLGMYFSDTLIDLKNDDIFYAPFLNYSPQFFISELIETDNWVKQSGCFKAKQANKYLLIGNFFDDARTSTKKVSDNNRLLEHAYYLIDDVFVEELAYELPEFSLGRDTTLCDWQNFTISPQLASLDSLRYRWQNGDTSQTYIVRQPGIYWVDITRGVCTVRDSMVVRYEPAVNLGKDTVLCKGETLNLKYRHPRHYHR